MSKQHRMQTISYSIGIWKTLASWFTQSNKFTMQGGIQHQIKKESNLYYLLKIAKKKKKKKKVN